MGLRNRLLLAAAVLLVVVLSYAGWRASRTKEAVTFDTVTVARGRLVAKVTASGTLSALVTVQVGSQVSGRLAQIDVDFNSPVKKGQVLAKIDPSIFEAQVEQSRANLTVSEGALEKAKVQAVDAGRQFERSKTLAEKKLIAQADLDTAQATADAAQAQVRTAEGSVAQARASLHQSQTNLAYTTITSPISGTVISRTVDVGQTVAATLSAPTLFTIAEDLRKMQVDTSVAEADVGKLKAGMSASFFVDAYPTKRFEGVVRQIRNAATTVQNVVTYDAVIDVDNPDLDLKPGMTATVTFVYASKDDVLEVPNAALRFRPSAAMIAKIERREGKEEKPGKEGKHSKHALAEKDPAVDAARSDGAISRAAKIEERAPDEREVWVLEGKHPHPVSVKVGVSDGTSTEIVEGPLAEGQQVVTGMSGGSGAGPAGGSGSRGGGGFKRMF